jgi:hypothetical protein
MKDKNEIKKKIKLVKSKIKDNEEMIYLLRKENSSLFGKFLKYSSKLQKLEGVKR